MKFLKKFESLDNNVAYFGSFFAIAVFTYLLGRNGAHLIPLVTSLIVLPYIARLSVRVKILENEIKSIKMLEQNDKH